MNAPSFLALLALSRCGAVRQSSLGDLEDRRLATCGVERLRRAAEIIGIQGIDGSDGSFTVDQLATALEEPREDLWELMQQMNLNATVSLTEFCKASMASMHDMLGQEAPLPDMACLDAECHEEVSISLEDLAKVPLVPPPPEHDNIQDTQGVDEAHDKESQKEPQNSRKSPAELLQHVVQGLFEVLLLPEIANEDSKTSVLETEPSPEFGGYARRSGLQEDFLKGVAFAIKYLEVAIDFFSSHGLRPHRVDVLFKKWFKSASASVKAMVVNHLKNIRKVLQNLRVERDNMGGDCETSTLAFVRNVCGYSGIRQASCGQRWPIEFPSQPQGRFVVHMCPAAWSQDVIFHAGNMIHEASHHFGSKDSAYGMRNCMALDHLEAVSNADTYIYFLQHLCAMIRDKEWASYRGDGENSWDDGVAAHHFALPKKQGSKEDIQQIGMDDDGDMDRYRRIREEKTQKLHALMAQMGLKT